MCLVFSGVNICVLGVFSVSFCVFQGLAVHDLIIQFGSVTKSNFEGLQTIGRVVQHSRDVSHLIHCIQVVC